MSRLAECKLSRYFVASPNRPLLEYMLSCLSKVRRTAIVVKSQRDAYLRLILSVSVGCCTDISGRSRVRETSSPLLLSR